MLFFKISFKKQINKPYQWQSHQVWGFFTFWADLAFCAPLAAHWEKLLIHFLNFAIVSIFPQGKYQIDFFFQKRKFVKYSIRYYFNLYLELNEDKIPLNNFHISGSRHVSYLRISAFPAQCATFCFHVPRLDMILNSRLSTNCKLKKKEYVCLGLLLLAWLQKQ